MYAIDKINRIIASSKNPKYDKDVHIKLLFESIAKGGSVASFCSEALITKDTFYAWCRKYPKFKIAYEIANNMSEVIWENHPLHDRTFDYRYWSTIMRTRFNFGRKKLNFSKVKNPDKRIKAIWKELSNGEITIDEVVKLMNLVVMEINLKMNEKANNTSQFIEAKEKLLNNLDSLDSIINAMQDNNNQ